MTNLKKLTLLHSNDMHGDFLTDNVDQKLIGGVSMLSGYVNKTKEEIPNTLYCIAGDMLQGSIIDSEFKGISTIEIMNLINPDIICLGNHEVDYGIAHLVFLEKCAKFPIINANMYITTTKSRLFNSHKIIRIDGMNILFIGILTESVLDSTKKDKLIGMLVDVEDAAKEVGRVCNAYKTTDIDLTILLTHIGFEEDKILASKLDPNWGIDIIIGGHSHTILEKPEVVNNILIVQAGTGTNQIGRFDIVIDKTANAVKDYQWQLIPIDKEHCPNDDVLDGVLARYKSQTDEKYGKILARFKRKLTHPDRYTETELGNLFSDILKKYLETDLVLTGSGSIRLEEAGPLLTLGDLLAVYPYDSKIYELKLTGAQLKACFAFVMSEENLKLQSEFYQVSKGFKVAYDNHTKCITQISFDDVPVEDSKLYTVAIQDYHFANFGKFFGTPIEEITKNAAPRVVSTSAIDIYQEYFSITANIDSKVEGRIVIIQ